MVLNSRGRAGGYLLLFAGMALVGTYVALSRPLVTMFPVFLLALLRFAIAAVVMIPWMRADLGDAPLDAGLARRLFWMSFFGNFLFSILMLSGVARTSSGAAGLVLATLPAMVALLSWVLPRERLGMRASIALALAVVSMALLSIAPQASGDAHAASATSWIGNLLVLGCVVCEAIYVILGKTLTGQLAPRRISALINLVGLALMLPLGLWQSRGFDFSAVPAGQWALLGFYALSASMISTWLFLSGLARVPRITAGCSRSRCRWRRVPSASWYWGSRSGCCRGWRLRVRRWGLGWWRRRRKTRDLE
jgi:drug/metabolite transporter (DMT)-like permease